jgi:hypothetical protein
MLPDPTRQCVTDPRSDLSNTRQYGQASIGGAALPVDSWIYGKARLLALCKTTQHRG